MKKFLFLLLALPLIAILSSCNDEKNIPDVNVGFTYSGATEVNGTLYAVQGDTLQIDSVYCTPVQGTKPALVANVTYQLDGLPLAYNPVSPFKLSLLTGTMPTGSHVLGLRMTVLQEGKSIGTVWLPIKIAVVANSAEVPSSANPTADGIQASYSAIVHPTE